MKDYTLSLDIGTNSIGWAIVDDDLNLLKRKMTVYGDTDKKKVKRNFWGSLLYNTSDADGKITLTAKARAKRGMRRRLRRRKYRIQKLQEIFQPAIEVKDANFFVRLNESFLIPEDKTYSKYPIFGNRQDELAYHKTFPTVYHLRKELVDNPEQKDIRLVYLALAHILKSRGNFNYADDLNMSQDIDITKELKAIFKLCCAIKGNDELDLSIDDNKKEEINKIIKSGALKELNELFSKLEAKGNGKPYQEAKTLFSECCKLMTGYAGKIAEVKLSFRKADYEEQLAEIETQNDGDKLIELSCICQNVYSYIILNKLVDLSVPSEAKLSANMVNSYNKYANDLQKYKYLLRAYNQLQRENRENNDEKAIGSKQDAKNIDKKRICTICLKHSLSEYSIICHNSQKMVRLKKLRTK